MRIQLLQHSMNRGQRWLVTTGILTVLTSLKS